MTCYGFLRRNGLDRIPGENRGPLKIAASRVGATPAEYEARLANGEKWCVWCKAWHSLNAFTRDRTRWDGRNPYCKVGVSAGRERQRENNKARAVLSYAVKVGRLPRAADLACVDCGHLGPDRQHQYDHHNGYGPGRELDVEPVCRPCHLNREVDRGKYDYAQKRAA